MIKLWGTWYKKSSLDEKQKYLETKGHNLDIENRYYKFFLALLDMSLMSHFLRKSNHPTYYEYLWTFVRCNFGTKIQIKEKFIIFKHCLWTSKWGQFHLVKKSRQLPFSGKCTTLEVAFTSVVKFYQIQNVNASANLIYLFLFPFIQYTQCLKILQIVPFEYFNIFVR